MHRPNRCLLTLAAALAVGGPSLSHPALAQSGTPDTASASAPAPAPATPAKHKIKKRAPAKPTGRLAVRMRLGDGRETWHPTRQQIGVGYAPGGSDASPSGAFKFVVNRAKLRAYLTSIAPYVRRAPKNAMPVVAHASAGDQGTDEVAAQVVPGYDGAVLDVDAAVD